MPLVKIHLPKGKSKEYKRAVGDGVHHALVKVANVPPDDRFQLFFETEPQNVIADPNYGKAQRSPQLTIIEITFNLGRTLETKKALYAQIVNNLGAEPGIPSDDVFINLVEVPGENWSFAHGTAMYAP
ncbi:MAG: tautomerase family protein [Chloroflexi bacterium]|nr:tautomerase family protein [Chloroflexota bacterium]